jgi:hypothetical protein
MEAASFSRTIIQSTRHHIPEVFYLGTSLVAEVKCQEFSVQHSTVLTELFWLVLALQMLIDSCQGINLN